MANGKEIRNDANVVKGAFGYIRSYGDCSFALRIGHTRDRASNSRVLAVRFVAICGALKARGISLRPLSKSSYCGVSSFYALR